LTTRIGCGSITIPYFYLRRNMTTTVEKRVEEIRKRVFDARNGDREVGNFVFDHDIPWLFMQIDRLGAYDPVPIEVETEELTPEDIEVEIVRAPKTSIRATVPTQEVEDEPDEQNDSEAEAEEEEAESGEPESGEGEGPEEDEG
jgi:hypothetical protein